MKTIEQIDAEIARLRAQINAEIAALQAEREARKSEPDLSDAVEAYWDEYRAALDACAEPDACHKRALIAAYPALHKVLGPRSAEPTEADDLAMAEEVYRSLGYSDHVTDVILAAFKAERKRAGGGK
jgi:hypothetical protein